MMSDELKGTTAFNSSLIIPRSSFLFRLRRHLLLHLRIDPLALDVEAQTPVEAHVLVRHPDEREAAHEVAAPVFVEEVVARDGEEEDRHVMAEAVFAREEVEKLSLPPAAAGPALPDAELARLAEHLLVRHRPRDAGDGYGEEEECDDLPGQAHTVSPRLMRA